MEFSEAVSDAMDGILTTYRQEYHNFKKTRCLASLARQICTEDDDDLEELDPEVAAAERSKRSSRRDECCNSLNQHEYSRLKMSGLRSELVDIHRMSGETLQKIDELLSGEVSPVETEVVYRCSFESTHSGGASASNRELLHKARCSMKRLVKTYKGFPVPSTSPFMFGDTVLHGWETCALYDVIIRLAEEMEDAKSLDDQDDFDAAFEEMYFMCGAKQEGDVDDEPIEASPELKRLVVPRRLLVQAAAAPSAVTPGPPPPAATAPSATAPAAVTPGPPAPSAAGPVSAFAFAPGPSTSSPSSTIAVNHIVEVCKDLDKCCVRPRFGKITASGVGAEIERLMSKRRVQRASAWNKLRRQNPEDKHMYDAWYFDMHKAFESHPGLYDDVSKLCTLFKYPVTTHHGIYLKDWKLEHRYCLQNLLKSYQSPAFSYQRVKSFDRHEIYEIAALIHPRGPLANYTTSSLKTSCQALASTYLNSEWLFPNVWEWPSMLIWKVRELIETCNLSGNFDVYGEMNVHKIAYLDNFLNKVPLDITGVFGTVITEKDIVDWDTLVKYSEVDQGKMFRLAFQSIHELPELTYTPVQMRVLIDTLHDQEVLGSKFQDVVKIIMAAGEMQYAEDDGELLLDVEHISVRTFTKLYKVLVVGTGRDVQQQEEQEDDDVPMDDDEWDDLFEEED